MSEGKNLLKERETGCIVKAGRLYKQDAANIDIYFLRWYQIATNIKLPLFALCFASKLILCRNFIIESFPEVAWKLTHIA